MRTGANPFTDPAHVQGQLYATAGRLASRTSADVIAELAASAACLSCSTVPGQGIQ